jgi:hypothetical protein
MTLASTSRHLREGSFSVYGPRFFTKLKCCLHPISLQALHDISCTPYIAKYVFNVAFGTEDEGASNAIHNIDFRKNQSPHSVVPLELMSSMKELHLSNEPMQTESATISQALVQFQKLAMIMIGKQCAFEGTEIRPSIGKVASVKFTCRCIHYRNRNRSKSAYDVYLTAVSAINQMEKYSDHVKMGISLGHSDYARARAQLILMNWHFDENITRQITNLQLNLHDENWRGAHRLGLNDHAKYFLIDTLEVSYLDSFEPLYQRLCFSDLD